jgi:hypothetical protein
LLVGSHLDTNNINNVNTLNPFLLTILKINQYRKDLELKCYYVNKSLCKIPIFNYMFEKYYQLNGYFSEFVNILCDICKKKLLSFFDYLINYVVLIDSSKPEDIEMINLNNEYKNKKRKNNLSNNLSDVFSKIDTMMDVCVKKIGKMNIKKEESDDFVKINKIINDLNTTIQENNNDLNNIIQEDNDLNNIIQEDNDLNNIIQEDNDLNTTIQEDNDLNTTIQEDNDLDTTIQKNKIDLYDSDEDFQY